MNALDLVVVAPELIAFQDIMEHIQGIGGHAEILLDRRRAERRQYASDASEERRRGERRTLDISTALQALGWAHIPADQRPPAP